MSIIYNMFMTLWVNIEKMQCTVKEDVAQGVG